MKVFVVLLAISALAHGAPKAVDSNAIPLVDGRIVGGDPANIADYPYQISLQYYGSHICGGSIIASKWVVTAAHCTDGFSASALSIRAGSSTRGSGGQVINVKKINQNPSYNSNTIDYDISVLELASAITVSNAQAIGLPVANANVETGATATITGWGTTSEGGSSPTQLQVVQVPIVSAATCRSAYGSSSITSRMLCAGLTQGGKDACQGDSGGPLVVGGKLVGIVSWGYGCARPNYPGVYSSVPALRSYITQVAGI
ncbi:trypsin-7-like [Aethina tumida]|uniref:trypsin-7-like n=1 Tax=Aethina tumida TaxID=116153 RepID=UPI00214757F7|nr:trypsin-7-like [Aethina tumida]